MYQKTNIIKLMKMLHNGDPDFLIIRNIHSEVKENEGIEVIENAEN